MAAFLQNADAPARGYASRADYFLARVLVPAREMKPFPKPHTLCDFGIVLCPLKKTESQEKTKNKKTPPVAEGVESAWSREARARGAQRRLIFFGRHHSAQQASDNLKHRWQTDIFI